jgi:hypothetical protein
MRHLAKRRITLSISVACGYTPTLTSALSLPVSKPVFADTPLHRGISHRVKKTDSNPLSAINL